LPPGAFIDQIIIKNATGNAVTGGIAIGSSSGAADIVAAQACGANALTHVADASILKCVLSDSVSTRLSSTAVTAWNGANVTISIVFGFYWRSRPASATATAATCTSEVGLVAAPPIAPCGQVQRRKGNNGKQKWPERADSESKIRPVLDNAVINARAIGFRQAHCSAGAWVSARSNQPKNSEVDRDCNERRDGAWECDAQRVLCRAAHCTDPPRAGGSGPTSISASWEKVFDHNDCSELFPHGNFLQNYRRAIAGDDWDFLIAAEGQENELSVSRSVQADDRRHSWREAAGWRGFATNFAYVVICWVQRLKNRDSAGQSRDGVKPHECCLRSELMQKRCCEQLLCCWR
jgi:hypothetical protein